VELLLKISFELVKLNGVDVAIMLPELLNVHGFALKLTVDDVKVIEPVLLLLATAFCWAISRAALVLKVMIPLLVNVDGLAFKVIVEDAPVVAMVPRLLLRMRAPLPPAVILVPAFAVMVPVLEIVISLANVIAAGEVFKVIEPPELLVIAVKALLTEAVDKIAPVNVRLPLFVK